MQGSVKKILAEKQCGFISQEGVEKDVFFSADKLSGITFEEIKEGDTVTFEVEEGDKGPFAVNVAKA